MFAFIASSCSFRSGTCLLCPRATDEKGELLISFFFYVFTDSISSHRGTAEASSHRGTAEAEKITGWPHFFCWLLADRRYCGTTAFAAFL